MNTEVDILHPRDIGSAIRAERKRLGFSQEMLAAAAGVNPRFVGELERGKETVQLGKVLLVLHAVGLRVQVLGP